MTFIFPGNRGMKHFLLVDSTRLMHQYKFDIYDSCYSGKAKCIRSESCLFTVQIIEKRSQQVIVKINTDPFNPMGWLYIALIKQIFDNLWGKTSCSPYRENVRLLDTGSHPQHLNLERLFHPWNPPLPSNTDRRALIIEAWKNWLTDWSGPKVKSACT